MHYFIILPLFVLLVALLLLASLVTRIVPSLRPASGYIVGGTIGSVVAFIVGNILVTLLGVLIVLTAGVERAPDWLKTVGVLSGAGTMVLGAVIASTVGVVIGFLAGMRVVQRRRKRWQA